jgi:deoxyribonuclease V
VEWKQEQLELAKRVVLKDDFKRIEHVVGLDLGYEGEQVTCAAAVFHFETKKFIEGIVVQTLVDTPYIPTYLSYRELPAIERVMEKVDYPNMLLMFDGNGVLHPRRIGIASHAGVVMDIPTLGVAKNLLCGDVKRIPTKLLQAEAITLESELVGYALKSSDRAKRPIYVSPGHRVSFQTALEVVKRFCGFRIPEPIREAHRLASSSR